MLRNDSVLNPDIVDIVEQFIGPYIILWGSGVFRNGALAGPASNFNCMASRFIVGPADRYAAAGAGWAPADRKKR